MAMKSNKMTDEKFRSDLPDSYFYPAIFTFGEDGVSVEFPDLDGCFTGGSDVQEAHRLAEDVLAGYLSILEEEGRPIPKPSVGKRFDLQEKQEVVLVRAWMPPYRENYRTRAVKKTVTLPSWLKKAAEERHINFSRVLQEALMKQLGITIKLGSSDSEDWIE
ncbi:MAG TPA: type II toxin-antitoxin system HicB family antitoxin [Alicyclobacillus sp.]|nr:type II toxin-antitoxin system HicB family antitoxin [Alicyclobacillus sp.]